MTGLPNTFQTYNIHVDRAMELLTPPEYKVLSFATRHILGWQESIDELKKPISLSMFENGFTSQSGKRFGGVGMGRQAIIDAVSELVKYGLLERIGEPTPKGQCYGLCTAGIDWKGLEKRLKDSKSKAQQRTAKANQSRAAGTSHVTGTSDNTMLGTSDNTMLGTSDVTQLNPPINPPINPNTRGKRANSSSSPKPSKAVSKYTLEECRQFWADNAQGMDSLAYAVGWNGEPHTHIEQQEYIAVYKQLQACHFTDYAGLVRWIKSNVYPYSKGDILRVNALPKNVTAYRNSQIKPAQPVRVQTVQPARELSDSDRKELELARQTIRPAWEKQKS